MYRHPALRPLSRGHLTALMHARDLKWRAVYVERGDSHLGEKAVGAFLDWAATDLEPHFAAEENILLPAMGPSDAADRTLKEHALIREATQALRDTPDDLDAIRHLSTTLHDHVRFEERELYPLAESTLGAEALAEIERQLDSYVI